MNDHDNRFSKSDRGNGPSDFTEDRDNAEPLAIPDLAAVQADDVLLDSLGDLDLYGASDLEDHEITALLLEWRRDIDSEPLVELVDTETAVNTVQTASLARLRSRSERRRRMWIPTAVAASVLAIAFTGSGLAARDAQPGDALWGLTKVLYSGHARSVAAATTVRGDLTVANVALKQGRLEDARKALEEAQATLEQVSSEDDRAQLTEQHQQLTAKLLNPAAPDVATSTPGNSSNSSATNPGTQLTSTPSVPPSLEVKPTSPPPSPTSSNPPPETSTTPIPSSTVSTASEPGGTGPRSDTSDNPNTSNSVDSSTP